MQWIKCADKMPERYALVLAVHEDNRVIKCLMAWTGNDWTIGASDDKYRCAITHWMPLPDAPIPSAGPQQ